MKEEKSLVSNEYGYCHYCVCDDCAMIHNLYIEKKYRKNGHARYLVQSAIHAIRATGYERVIKINAEPREDSISRKNLIAFYEKMGLKVISM